MSEYFTKIRNSGLTIYDNIDPTDRDYYIPTEELHRILENALIGLSLDAKFIKTKICEALGYPIPKSFKRTHPRFPGQNFDVYTQKLMNVQIWNEEIDPNRRYVFLKVNESHSVVAIRIITGEQLAVFDKTGTLTKKYQATMSSYDESTLFTLEDTAQVKLASVDYELDLKHTSPNSLPVIGEMYTISKIFEKLLPLVGCRLKYINAVQERNRGAELHAEICKSLGYSVYEDDGAYPDIRHQLLEIKLQTSPTIDLGLHSPMDESLIVSSDIQFYSEDVRYAIFSGEVQEDFVLIKNLYVVNGRDFQKYFPLFKGKVQNAKLQMHLPTDFFN